MFCQIHRGRNHLKHIAATVLMYRSLCLRLVLHQAAKRRRALKLMAGAVPGLRRDYSWNTSFVLSPPPAGRGVGCNRRCFSFDPNNIQVEHDDLMKVFYIDLGEESAYMKYDISGKTLTVFVTRVPEAYQGHKLGYVLAKELLDYAVNNGYTINVQCALVEKYIKRHAPHYADYVEH